MVLPYPVRELVAVDASRLDRDALDTSATQFRIAIFVFRPVADLLHVTRLSGARGINVGRFGDFDIGVGVEVPEPADVADALAIAICGHHFASSPLAKLR